VKIANYSVKTTITEWKLRSQSENRTLQSENRRWQGENRELHSKNHNFRV